MRILAITTLSFLLLAGSSTASAGEEIQLAAAIGARAISKPAGDEALRRPEPEMVGNALSKTAMISIGVGAAVVVGVVAGGSSSSTTSH